MACVSGWHDIALAVGLFAQPRRLVKRCVVAQRGVANARQLVRQRAGGLVVVASPLHIQRPAAHALSAQNKPIDLPARRSRDLKEISNLFVERLLLFTASGRSGPATVVYTGRTATQPNQYQCFWPPAPTHQAPAAIKKKHIPGTSAACRPPHAHTFAEC